MNIGQLEHLVKRFQQGEVSATELGTLSVADLDLINAYLAGCRRVYSEFGATARRGTRLHRTRNLVRVPALRPPLRSGTLNRG